MIWSLFKGPKADPNPWGAASLEWQTPDTPPAHGNWRAPVGVPSLGVCLQRARRAARLYYPDRARGPSQPREEKRTVWAECVLEFGSMWWSYNYKNNTRITTKKL